MRFVSPDPLVGTSGPQSLNRYAYAQNNPTSASDPTGHAVVWNEAEQAWMDDSNGALYVNGTGWVDPTNGAVWVSDGKGGGKWVDQKSGSTWKDNGKGGGDWVDEKNGGVWDPGTGKWTDANGAEWNSATGRWEMPNSGVFWNGEAWEDQSGNTWEADEGDGLTRDQTDGEGTCAMADPFNPARDMPGRCGAGPGGHSGFRRATDDRSVEGTHSCDRCGCVFLVGLREAGNELHNAQRGGHQLQGVRKDRGGGGMG